MTTPDFEIDLATKRFVVIRDGGHDEVLTPIEWALVQRLVLNRGVWCHSASCCRTCGDLPTGARRTTSGCTSPTCGARSNRFPRGPATS
ncbi:MAG: hypothetical protein R2716_00090 [Microthrixaceae bacterium]